MQRAGLLDGLAMLVLLSFVALALFGTGPRGSGTRINLGPVQPIEAVKVAAVLFLASYLGERSGKLRFQRVRVLGLLFPRPVLLVPALLALANRVEERPDRREVPLGAVVEIIHLATLVHDDSIDGSSLRRGLPTLNNRWGHKVSIIMGDYLYSRAMAEITRIGDLELIGLAARVTNELTMGEMVEIALTAAVG